VEMRVFSEQSLKEILVGVGFVEVRIASESIPEFGVDHAETWSLPIVARKGNFQPPSVEMALAYRAANRRATSLERDVSTLQSDVSTLREQAAATHRELDERLKWVQKLQAEFDERTQWALALRKELDEVTAAHARVNSRLWTRIGRKLGLLS